MKSEKFNIHSNLDGRMREIDNEICNEGGTTIYDK